MSAPESANGGAARLGYFDSLGMITALALNSRLHAGWLVVDLGRNVVPALRAGQCKIYFDDKDLPSAFVTWALVDDEAHEALRSRGSTPAPDRWTCGDHLWFIDVVAPFGNARHLIRDLQHNHFARTAVAHAVRRNPDGSVRRIQTWRNPAAPNAQR